MPPEFERIHTLNQQFVAELVPQPAEGYSEMDLLVIEACAGALTDADYRLGRNTGGLGTMCTEVEDGFSDGLWNTMPPFYHNGDGTRLAMLGTEQYMALVNRLEGPLSPYANRQTYLTTLLTAAFDDVVFGAHGRGGDELQSAAIAEAHLRSVGLPESWIKDVVTGIKASIFDEVTGKQRYNPASGAEAVQRGSLIGDLWALGLPQATLNSMLLMVENFWKKDAFFPKGQEDSLQLLRSIALKAVVDAPDFESAWRGRELGDFLRLVQSDEKMLQKFGGALMGNKKFLLDYHRYVDSRIDALMLPGKIQNARLQELVGDALIRGANNMPGAMSVEQALNCVIAYAGINVAAWQAGDQSLPELDNSPETISGVLLAKRSLWSLAHPVDAEIFFTAYKQKYGII